jgi:nucleotide-binding universal stress UspA family protein
MFKTIVWATDGSESADAALPYAKSLAVQNGAALVVVHAVEHIVGRGGGYLHVNEDELQAKIERQTAELKEAGLDVRSKAVSGAATGAAHMIAEVAREVGADVIVVGTRGHTALAGLLVGSVTQRLLHVAPCPVLAVPASVQPNG